MSDRLPSPVDLALGPGADPDRVLSALAQNRPVGRGTASVSRHTYLDTFDARLRGAGLTLTASRQTGERLGALTLTTAGGQVMRSDGHPAGSDRLFVTDLAPGPLRDRLRPVVEMRALLPQARVKIEQKAARVENGEAKTVVRLLFEQTTVLPRGRDPVALTSRLRVSPVLGYDRAFAAVTETLGALRGIGPVKSSARDEAIIAAGGNPAGVSAKIAVSLWSSMRTDDATIALCRRLAEVVEANLAGALADIDTEFLHDLRVAIRRGRSVLREMSGVFLPADGDRAGTDLRWIQEITGPTRDLDVQLLDWTKMVDNLPAAAAADLKPLHDLLEHRRAEAWESMERQLRGRRFTEAWSRWRDLLDRPRPIGPEAARPNAHRPIAEVAGTRILSVYRRMVKMGAAISDHSPPEALHDLRKRGKEFRYLLELYGQLWPAETVSPMVGAMKGLQDVLGRFQDDEIQSTYLRSLAPELLATSGSTDAVIALGLVIDRLDRDQAYAREGFTVRFEAFAAPANYRLVTTTFGPRG